MNSYRKSAIIIGVLFITATVTAILGALVLSAPILDDPDYLINGAAKETQVITAMLFELISAAAVVGTAIVIFPILKKYNEALAIGYVGFRVIEAVLIIVGLVSVLSLLTLSREFVEAGTPDARNFLPLGAVLIALHDWTLYLGPNIILGVASSMLYYLLYQSKLIPRFLSVWGLIAAPLVLVLGVLSMFGLDRFSTISFLLASPIALIEMVLAVWLIAKGFNSSAGAPESA